MRHHPQLRLKSSISLHTLTVLIFCGGLLIRWSVPVLRHSTYIVALWSALLIGTAVFRKPVIGLQRRRLKSLSILLSCLVATFSLTLIILIGTSGEFFLESVKEFILLSLPVVVAMGLVITSPAKSFDFLFYALFAVYTVLASRDLISDGFSIAEFRSIGTAFISSSFGGESFFSLGFGLLTVFAFVSNKKLSAIILFCLTIITFKRIALLAVVGALGLYLLGKLFRNKYVWIVFGVVINLAFILVAFNLASGAFDSFIGEFTSLPTRSVTQGRSTTFAIMFSMVENVFFPLGTGMGSVSSVLDVAALSDVVKWYVQFGLLLFIMIFGFLYKHASSSNSALAILVYMNILLMTDNVSIYVEFMPPAIAFILSFAIVETDGASSERAGFQFTHWGQQALTR